MTLGEILKEARKAKNLTINELAKKSGVSFVSVGDYEREKRIPRAAQLHALCEALELDFDRMYKIAYPKA